MKKTLITLIYGLYFIASFGQGVAPVSTSVHREANQDRLHFYRGDSVIEKISNDTIRYRTNQNAYMFDKDVFVNGINIAEGGSIIINNDTVLSLDTTNIVYKSTPDTITAIKTFLSGILAGANANFTDFPNARFVSSFGNSGHTYAYNIGVVGESVSGASGVLDIGVGVGGVSTTNAGNGSRGVVGVGKVGLASYAGIPYGAYFRSEDVHTAGVNVGVSIRAANSTVGNYALSFAGGDISSNTNSLNWLLYDNQTSALSFDATGRTGLLKLITTNGAEKVEINGEVDVISTLNSIYGTYNYLTGTYCIGNFNYTTGANSNAIENTAEGYQAMAGAFYTYGIEGTGQYTKTNSYRAIPGIFESTLCDTILQLDKGATNILNIEDFTSSVKLNSEKDLFEFNKHIATVEVTKAYQTLTYAASVTMNTNIGANAKITLTGACALTLSNLTNGDEGNIIVTQDATGSRAITISPTPKVINGGSGVVTLSTTANSIDIISYTYDGTNLYITYGKNYN